MARKYDVVIVGAGPGGAMAAKTAGENGLSTAILERKTNPAEITGSMICGWKAAHAITVAHKDNKADREGVID